MLDEVLDDMFDDDSIPQKLTRESSLKFVAADTNSEPQEGQLKRNKPTQLWDNLGGTAL